MPIGIPFQIQPDHYMPQQLCVLCYKQCEVWKYFKEQCEENYKDAFDNKSTLKKKRNGSDAPAPVTIPRKKERLTAAKEEVVQESIEIADESEAEQDDFFGDGEDLQEQLNAVEPMQDDGSFGYIPSTSTEATRAYAPATTSKKYNIKNIDPVAVQALPESSRRVYLRSYQDFMTWKEEQGAAEITEDLLLDYFKFLVLVTGSRSPEQRMSHLKATLQLFHGISISEFSRLKEFVHQKSGAIVRKKAPEFTTKQLMQFVREAPDDKYSTTKVGVALMVAGCNKTDEIHGLKRLHVFDRGTHMEVLGVGSQQGQYFIKPSVADGYNPIPMIRHYMSESDDDFPWLLRTKANIRTGRNMIMLMPKVVAKYLGLEDPNSYTMFSIPRERRR